MTINRFFCILTGGHSWERPVYEDGKRVEHCAKCPAVQDFVDAKPIAAPAVFTQASLDGAVAVTVVVTPRVVEPVAPDAEAVAADEAKKAHHAAIAARVKEKHSGGLTTARLQ